MHQQAIIACISYLYRYSKKLLQVTENTGEQVAEAFKPRWYSVFFNPAYFIRLYLYKHIQQNASYISGTVLDFGSGKKPYRSLFTNAVNYIGVDYETEVSRKLGYRSADVYYDGKTIPFENNYFDAAFSSEVMEHVFNTDEILAEINRVLKPGGYFLFTCPFFCPEHEQPFDFARYTSFALKHLMDKHGFEVVRYEKTGSFIESITQSIVMYLHFFIPHKPAALKAIFFTIFITPFLLAGIVFSKILPARIKRNDLYLNNVMLARKI